MDIDCTYCPKNGQCEPSECIFIPIMEEVQRMHEFLEVTTSDNPKELVARLSDINFFMARSGKLLADAKEIQDMFTANIYAVNTAFISRVPATVATKYIASQCVAANKLVTWLERQNRALVHAGDNIRTQISFAKQDIALQRKGY